MCGTLTHRDLEADDRRHQDGEGAARVARPRRLVDGVAAHRDARDEQHEEESGVGADDDQQRHVAERQPPPRARALVVVLGVAREVEQLREDGAERRRDAEVGEPARRRAGGDRRRREIDDERAVDEEDAALDGADVHAALADVDAALAEQRARHRALARRAQLGRRVAARPQQRRRAEQPDAQQREPRDEPRPEHRLGGAQPARRVDGGRERRLLAQRAAARCGKWWVARCEQRRRWRGWRERCDSVQLFAVIDATDTFESEILRTTEGAQASWQWLRERETEDGRCDHGGVISGRRSSRHDDSSSSLAPVLE